MKKICVISVLFFCLPLLLSGCWDRTEIDQLGIVIMTAIDADDNGGIIGTVQMALPSASGGDQPAGGGEMKGFFTVSAKGKDIHDTMEHLQERIPLRLFVSHRRVLLIGESLARRGVEDVLDHFTRDPDSRLRTFILVVKGRNAGELLNIPIPSEKVPGQAVRELANSQIGIGSRLGDIVDAMANVGAVSLDVLEAVPASMMKGSEDKSEFAFRIAGTAVIKDYKLAGFLDTKKMRGLLWMTNNINRGTVTTKIPEEGEISFTIIKGTRNIKTMPQGHKVKVAISARAEGTIHENNTSLDLSDPKNVEKAEKFLSITIQRRIEQTIETAQKELNSDIFGIGEEVQRSHPKKWKNLKENWDDIFPQIEFTVSTKVTVQRSGMTGTPVHLKEEEVSTTPSK